MTLTKAIEPVDCLMCRKPVTQEHVDGNMTEDWYLGDGSKTLVHDWCRGYY